MEKQFEVKQIGISYICDQCNSGEMKTFDGAILLTDPPQFRHKCNNCGFEQNFRTKYPKVEFVRVN